LYLLVPGLALLAQLLQRRNNLAQQHQDNRGGNIRHDPEPEQAAAAQCSTCEHLHHLGSSAQRGLRLRRSLDYSLVVKTGNGDEETHPVDYEQRNGKDELVAQVPDSEYVDNCSKHYFISRILLFASLIT
jgi:hypothetical protein